MKNIFTGFLICYTVIGTLFTWGIYHGHIASSSQACVTRAVPTPANYLDALVKEGK